jgi:predicted RNA binding protein YcfA (HicA-like mRNA interferase family)
MKILRVDPKKDLPIRTIENILKMALVLYSSG